MKVPLRLRATTLLAALLLTACAARLVTEAGPAPDPAHDPLPPIPRDHERAFAEACDSFDSQRSKGLQAADCRRLAGVFEGVARLDWIQPLALYNAGVVWQECGDHAKATKLFERANASHVAICQRGRPGEGHCGFVPALVQLGAYAAKGGDTARAKRLLEEARDVDPRSSAVYTNLSRLHSQAGRPLEAHTDLRRALAVDMRYLPALIEMARYYIAGSAESPPQLDVAELVCQHAVGHAKQGDADPREKARVFNSCGVVAVKQGHHGRAASRFATARRLDSKLCAAHLNAGTTSLAYRDHSHAERALTDAVQCLPEAYDAHLALGTARRGLKQYGPALASFEKALRIDVARPAAHYNLGVLLQDYLTVEATDIPDQIKLFSKAKRSFLAFLERCSQRPAKCQRQLPDGDQQDLAELAASRIKACDATVAALREAMAVEAEPLPQQ